MSVLYRLEDYRGLEQLAAAVPEGSPLLPEVGAKFQSVGLCKQGVAAYVKVVGHCLPPSPLTAGKPCCGISAPCTLPVVSLPSGSCCLTMSVYRAGSLGGRCSALMTPALLLLYAWGAQLTRWLCLQAGELQRAVNCCVQLNHWDQAVDLARQHSLPQIETLLAQYAGRLLEDRRTLEAVQLYRKASDQLQGELYRKARDQLQRHSCRAASASAQKGCRVAGALCLERNCRRSAREGPSVCMSRALRLAEPLVGQLPECWSGAGSA